MPGGRTGPGRDRRDDDHDAIGLVSRSFLAVSQPTGDPEEPTHIHLTVPDELEAGTFSDLAIVWHNEHGFTLDFFAFGPPGMRNEAGDPVQPARAVARVKVPPSVIFQIAKAIADNVRRYEGVHGAITPQPTDVDTEWKEVQEDDDRDG